MVGRILGSHCSLRFPALSPGTVYTMSLHACDYVTLQGRGILQAWLRLLIDWLWVHPKKCYPGRPNLSHKSFKSGEFSLAGGRTIQSIRFEELLLAFKMERTTHKCQKTVASELRTTPGQQPARKQGLQSYNHMQPNSTNNLNKPGADSSADTRDKTLASQQTLTLALRPYMEHLVEPTSSDLQTVSW